MTDFADAARRYCAFIQRAGDLPLDQRLAEAQRELVALYAAALTLPGEFFDDDGLGRRPKPPANWKDFEGKDHYIEIFDPYGDDHEPVTSSLGEDLLEIYQDIGDNLDLWDRGHQRHALWQWHFSFKTHWGVHAVGAIKALHESISR